MLATPIPDAAVPIAQLLEETLRERLRDDKVKLPPYPAVATKLQAVTSTDTYGLRDIVKIVSSDASLSATVLRHASSAAMGAAKAVQSLEAAVQKLGEREVVRLAFTQSVGQATAAPGSLSILRRAHWRASLISATLCQGLAVRRGLRPEVAFLAGLLHDFGAVVALVGLEELAASQKIVGLPEEAWGQIVQNVHIDFGVLIATRWRLPTAIADVIATHHHAEACLKQNRSLVELVALVDRVLEALDQSGHEVDLFAAIPGLEPEDRALITTLVAEIEATMTSYEAMFPKAPPRAEAPSKVLPAPAADGSWPVDFPVTLVSDEYVKLRACSLAFNTLGIRGKKALPVNALTRIRLDCEPGPIAMLVTVKTCEPTPDGEHLMSLQPFGLDGPAKPAWLKLLASTRPGAGDPSTPMPVVPPAKKSFSVPPHKRLNF